MENNPTQLTEREWLIQGIQKGMLRDATARKIMELLQKEALEKDVHPSVYDNIAS